MSGRRSDDRYRVINAEGTLRLPRDVVLRRAGVDDFIAISTEPAAPGDLLTLERIVDGTADSIQVRVIDSHPVVVDGSVRHRLHLQTVERLTDTTKPRRQHEVGRER